MRARLASTGMWILTYFPSPSRERAKGEGPLGEGMRVRAEEGAVSVYVYLNSKVFHGELQHK